MSLTSLSSNHLVRWVFAVALFAVLILAALLTTPTGQAFIGQAQVAAEYTYYVYLSLIYK